MNEPEKYNFYHFPKWNLIMLKSIFLLQCLKYIYIQEISSLLFKGEERPLSNQYTKVTQSRQETKSTWENK